MGMPNCNGNTTIGNKDKARVQKHKLLFSSLALSLATHESFCKGVFNGK